tara:strand:- start:164 stop:484 length:321 start_codon:yes stop_codon:yes gene_type:complete
MKIYTDQHVRWHLRHIDKTKTGEALFADENCYKEYYNVGRPVKVVEFSSGRKLTHLPKYPECWFYEKSKEEPHLTGALRTIEGHFRKMHKEDAEELIFHLDEVLKL